MIQYLPAHKKQLKATIIWGDLSPDSFVMMPR